jgi:hypothetical protein
MSQCFQVNLSEIVTEDGIELHASRHAPFVPVEMEYEDPATIIRELIENEAEIARSLQELEQMLGDLGYDAAPEEGT